MKISYVIKYRKNMVSIFGGALFLNNKNNQEEEEEEDEEYKYSDSEYDYDSESDFYQSEDELLDNKTSKNSIEDQLNNRKLKLKKNFELQYKFNENEKKKKYDKYFNDLKVINLNSNINRWSLNKKFWSETEIPTKDGQTLIDGHYMTIDVFVNGLLKINDDKAKNIINRIREHGRRWKKGSGELPPRLDNYLGMAIDELKEEKENKKEENKKEENKKEEKDNKKEYDDIRNLLLKLKKINTRKELADYFNDNKLNMTIIINKIRKLNNPEELNNLLNEIRNKK
jgi:hypothetical protein